MKKQYVSAEDIQNLFYKPKRKRQLFSWQVASAILVITAGVFFAINAPAAIQQLRFWWESDIQQAQTAQLTTPDEAIPYVPQQTPQPTASSQTVLTTTTKNQAFDPAQIKDNSIYIPKIKVQAPIIWDVTAGADLNTDILNALQYGVVRYPQTALPDQIGNTFLTGHSSNYWWEKGSYKTIFALLDRLVVGDVIYVKYKGTLYTYKVVKQQVVKPDETSVLNPTDKPVLSLMTCTPTGTSLLRRVVTALLVSPTDNLKPQPTKPNPDGLQAIR